MIGWISTWAEAIIIAVIIATIIEMILPEGSSKKYIKVVIGVYIIFTIISPVISKFTGETLAVSDKIDLNKYIDEVKEKENAQNILQESNSASIREIYMGNLKADIQNKLKGKGYIVTKLELDVGYDDNYTLHQISLSIIKEDNENQNNDVSNTVNTSVETVNEVNISIVNTDTQSSINSEKNNKSNLSNSEQSKIIEYLSNVYEINEKDIVID